MKVAWEAEDVYGGRRMFSHNYSEEYIITWHVHRIGDPQYFALTSLIDGQTIMREMTAVQMAERLTTGAYLPSELHRPSTQPGGGVRK